MNFKELLKQKAEALMALYEAAETAGRDLTPDEKAQAEALEGEIASLEKTIAKKEALDEHRKAQSEPVNKEPFAPVDMSTQKEVKDDGGFKSMGEFIHTVRFAPTDPRLKDLRHQISKTEEFTTSDYGFLMPPAIASELREMDLAGNALVRPGAMVFPAGDIQPDAAITVPMVDQTSDDSNIFGGVEVAWIGEGGFKPETTKSLTSVTITPYELAASIRVTDKALRNFPALSPLFSRNLFAAMTYAEDIAFLLGTGDSQNPQVTPSMPLGIMKSDAYVEIARETAGNFTYSDAVNMLSRAMPGSVSGLEWVIDKTLLVDVYTMQDPSGRYVYGASDVSQSKPETLLGRPIRWTDKTAVSNKPAVIGDVLLADFSYYGIKDGFGPVIAASPHPFFQNNVTVIKAFTNVGGKPLLSGAIKLRNGMEASPFVALGPVAIP